jgi:hypothetical protein
MHHGRRRRSTGVDMKSMRDNHSRVQVLKTWQEENTYTTKKLNEKKY